MNRLITITFRVAVYGIFLTVFAFAFLSMEGLGMIAGDYAKHLVYEFGPKPTPPELSPTHIPMMVMQKSIRGLLADEAPSVNGG